MEENQEQIEGTEIPIEGQEALEPTAQPEVAPTQEVQGDFDPAQFAFKYKDKDIVPKDRNHIMSLMSSGFGASQEIQRLKMDREAFENERKSLDPYRQLDEQFQTNPQMKAKILELMQNEGQYTDELSPEAKQIADLKKELEDLKSFKSTMVEREAQQTLEKEIDTLKGKYKDHDWTLNQGNGTLEERLLIHAQKTNASSLEAAYRDLMWDNHTANSKAQALNQIKDKKRQETRQGVVNRSTGATPPQLKGTNKPNNYNDAAAEGVQELRAAGHG